MNYDVYISKEGDTLSGIAYRFYGSSRARVEAVLEANKDLCVMPAMLPAGVEIKIPVEKKAGVRKIKTVNLWD